MPGIAFTTVFWILYNFWNDVHGRAAIKELQKVNMHVTKVCKRVSNRKSKRTQAGFNPSYTPRIIQKKVIILIDFSKKESPKFFHR